MEDRELLELAAKAAGLNCRWWKVKQWKERKSKHGTARYYTGTKEVFGTHHAKPWDPLNDDGDALRLAVKLHLLVDVDQTNVMVITEQSNEEGIIVETTDGELDTYAATRRAIVSAAAQIGKSMP